MTDPILLRPHHALCLRFFEGKGYSEEYINNAWNVLRTLRENGAFTVTAGPDALCTACPNLNQNGICRWQEKVTRYDAAAAEKLELKDGGTYCFNAFSKTRAKELVPQICTDCEWAYICTKE